MPITNSSPVAQAAVPAVTLTQWGVQSLMLNRLPNGDYSANMRLIAAAPNPTAGQPDIIPPGSPTKNINIPSVAAASAKNANFATAFATAATDVIAAVNAYLAGS